MKEGIKLMFVMVALLLCVISCSDRYYKSSDFEGIFTCHSNIPDMEGEYPWTEEERLTGVVTYPTELDSVRDENTRGIMAYLQGDTGSWCYSYAAYHKLPSSILQLMKDGTFKIGFDIFIEGVGVWRLNNDNTISLEFDSYPKDTARYVDVALTFGGMEYQGVRNLKIINKDQLQFEYLLFNGKTKIKMKYRRLKLKE